MVRIFQAVVILLLTTATPAAVAQLPPEILADQYLLQADQQIAKNDHEGAFESLQKILALQKEHGLTLPEAFHFKYAQVAFAAGSFPAALDSVNQYLVAAGREGEFYQKALELLLAIKAAADRTPCAGQPKGAECWLELANQAGCYLWNSDFQPYKTVTWTAECAGGVAQGTGILKWVWDIDQGPPPAEYDRFTTATGRERADDEGWPRWAPGDQGFVGGRGGIYGVAVGGDGASYRLPSEAEWEYAARAGTETMYSWGNEIGHGFRIVSGPTARVALVGGAMRRRLRWDRSWANGWGLHDMPGNVNHGQWVQDCWPDGELLGGADGWLEPGRVGTRSTARFARRLLGRRRSPRLICAPRDRYEITTGKAGTTWIGLPRGPARRAANESLLLPQYL